MNSKIEQNKKVLSKEQLRKIVFSLREGEVVAFPTETVYALAGDAKNLSAIKKIFELKKRPLSQPLSVLLPENYDFQPWVANIPPLALRLAAHFWPGPLTLILNKNEMVLLELTGGQSTIGLRVPDHPVAQAILQAFGDGLAAPSANRYAQLSPTQAKHVRQEFGDQVAMVIESGICTRGIESTIVDVTTVIPKIRRLGAISREQLQEIKDIEYIVDISAAKQCIRTPLQQVIRDELPQVIDRYLQEGKSIAVLARQSPALSHKNLIWLVMPQDVKNYARVLYSYLHELEQAAITTILIETLPHHEEWLGLHNLINKFTF